MLKAKRIFKMNVNDIKEVNKCSYFCSVVTNTGGAEKDVKEWNRKTSTAFI
jgi:hypothetical protein